MSDTKPRTAAVPNIYQRIIEVQKKVLTVMKNEKIEMKGERGYKGVTHDDVAALLHLPLAESGIVLLPDITDFKVTEFETEKTGYNGKYIQRWYRTDMKILVKWINADDPDDFIQSTGGSFALDTSDKGFAKAYSLALKIVLLKVHLLESRDGEEQRTFEQDQPEQRQNTQKIEKKSEAAKANAGQPPTKSVMKNYAPATKQMIEQINGLCMNRGISEGELNYLITKGYGCTPGMVPAWIAKEMIDLLSSPDTSSATIMAQAQRVISRREAAKITGGQP